MCQSPAAQHHEVTHGTNGRQISTVISLSTSLSLSLSLSLCLLPFISLATPSSLRMTNKHRTNQALQSRQTPDPHPCRTAYQPTPQFRCELKQHHFIQQRLQPNSTITYGNSQMSKHTPLPRPPAIPPFPAASIIHPWHGSRCSSSSP